MAYVETPYGIIPLATWLAYVDAKKAYDNAEADRRHLEALAIANVVF